MEPNYASLDPEERMNKLLAIISIGLGLLSLCAGLIPLLGIVISLLGIVAGNFGRRSESKKIATFGIVLCAFSMLWAVIYYVFMAIRITG